MKTAEMTMAMQRIWIDWTDGMIQETFCTTWLNGVWPSQWAKASKVIAENAPRLPPLICTPFGVATLREADVASVPAGTLSSLLRPLI